MECLGSAQKINGINQWYFYVALIIEFMSNYKRFEKNTINTNLRPHISRRWLVISHFCKSVLSGFGQKSRRGLIEGVELHNLLNYFLKEHFYFDSSVFSWDFLVLNIYQNSLQKMFIGSDIELWMLFSSWIKFFHAKYQQIFL